MGLAKLGAALRTAASARTLERIALSMRVSLFLLFIAGGELSTVAANTPPAPGAHAVVLLPASFTLSGKSARQQLLVEKRTGAHLTGELTEGAKLISSDPNVVTIDGRSAIPVGNGSATISVEVGGQTAKSDVKVENFEQAAESSFRNHVQPVLAKSGCSTGACHGAAAGQGGFKLSLRGYDDEGDFLALTRQALGRRIAPADPGRSLMLTKPTTAVPHKGGRRFEVHSLDYNILAEWIAAGTPAPKKEDPRIESLEILPENVRLQPGDAQQLIVRARFSDGRVEDVTRWVKYNATNASVTEVDETGKVMVLGHGEGAITAWYLSRIAVATVAAPFPNQIGADVFAQAPRRNFIDELVLEKLASLNLPPSDRCTDGEFIRRVFLDVCGILPTATETRAFLADSRSDKRDRLIDHLLQRGEFVDYWAYKWSDLLLVNSKKLKPAAMWSYYNWIRTNVAANTPWDVFVRGIITAQGSTLENGAANFYVLHDDPRALTETTSLAFMGVSMNCAKCHNHPMEKWTNNDYFGMANLFARVRSKNGAVDGDNIIFASATGDLVQPLTGKPQAPRPLDGNAIPFEAPGDRREHLAAWLVAPDNPYFSRAVVNRVWANFLGVGLVENVDDLRATNPASNEKLFAACARFLSDHGYDLKALMRLILQSETYQRTSTPLQDNLPDSRFYSRYYPKRMMAEVLLDALSQVSGKPAEFKNFPAGWRAVQLPDANVESYFLKAFGRPDREVTCECERTDEPSVTQALHIANGDTINKKLGASGNRISQFLEEKKPIEDVVEEVYLSALARLPTPVESERIRGVFTNAREEDQRPLIEDVCWAVLSSKEFLFNH